MKLGPNIVLDSKQNFETLIMVSGKKDSVYYKFLLISHFTSPPAYKAGK